MVSMVLYIRILYELILFTKNIKHDWFKVLMFKYVFQSSKWNIIHSCIEVCASIKNTIQMKKIKLLEIIQLTKGWVYKKV